LNSLARFNACSEVLRFCFSSKHLTLSAPRFRSIHLDITRSGRRSSMVQTGIGFAIKPEFPDLLFYDGLNPRPHLELRKVVRTVGESLDDGVACECDLSLPRSRSPSSRVGGVNTQFLATHSPKRRPLPPILASPPAGSKSSNSPSKARPYSVTCEAIGT